MARTLEFEKLHLPTVKESQRVKANLEKRKDYIMTEVSLAPSRSECRRSC